jgi:DNA-binding NtrC family response regulator
LNADAPLPLVGPGVVMRALAARAEELRRDVTRPVMVVGARGLGKQLLAQRIHAGSALSSQPLRVLDARRDGEALLRQLFADALHGTALHGSATHGSATHGSALHGTVLLVRHVEQLSMPAQILLNQRTGERSTVARLLATAGGDVVARVTAGTFLEALYYRLHAWPMLVPALASRDAADLLALISAVLAQTADSDPDLPTTIDAAAASQLLAHEWPDNLRELEATLALAQLHARGAAVIGESHLSLRSADADAPPAHVPLADVERWHLLRALAAHHGNRTHAARSLGISRMTLIGRLKLFSDGLAS